MQAVGRCDYMVWSHCSRGVRTLYKALAHARCRVHCSRMVKEECAQRIAGVCVVLGGAVVDPAMQVHDQDDICQDLWSLQGQLLIGAISMCSVAGCAHMCADMHVWLSSPLGMNSL